MHLTQIIPALAVAVSVAAAAIDVKERRIPNRLTYPAVVCGVLLQVALRGWTGLLLGAGGVLVFAGVFVPFYLIRAIGAGDVKLAAALGGIVGIGATLQVMLATALAGGVLAVFVVAGSGRIVETLRNTLWVAGFHLQHGLQTHPVVNLDNPAALRMPYGLAFAGGTLYWAIFLQSWR